MTRLAPIATLAFLAAGEVSLPPLAEEYSLLDPVPREKLRPLSTDRPDQTESPYTVDAGRFQLEMDIVSASFDDDGELRSTTWNVVPVNFKLGLRQRVDLQLVLDTYVRARFEDEVAGTTENASGIGDLATRVKINVWGNDGGRTALAVMPYVKWPLPASDVRNGQVEAGLIVPFGMSLSERWGLGAMTEVDFVGAAASAYDAAWVNSITVGYDLTERLAMYAELFAVLGIGPSWRGQLDVGWTYALGENGQLDWGCNFGITDSAPDFNPFVGYARRF